MASFSRPPAFYFALADQGKSRDFGVVQLDNQLEVIELWGRDAWHRPPSRKQSLTSREVTVTSNLKDGP